MNYAMRYLCWKWINLENNLNDNSNILYFVVDRTFRGIESENSRFNYRGVLEVLAVPEKSVAGVPKPRFHYLVKKQDKTKQQPAQHILFTRPWYLTTDFPWSASSSWTMCRQEDLPAQVCVQESNLQTSMRAILGIFSFHPSFWAEHSTWIFPLCISLLIWDLLLWSKANK